MPTASSWVSDETDERIKDYQADDQTYSAAVAELIEAGLRAKERQGRQADAPASVDDAPSERLGWALAALFVLTVLGAVVYGLAWFAGNVTVSVS